MGHRLLGAAILAFALDATASAAPDNPAIDMQGFLGAAAAAAEHRAWHRITEDEFLQLRDEHGTIVLDARSREKYDELHVSGAVNLAFPDITVESMRATIPDRETIVLIYCNNNFTNAEGPFPSNLPAASLNLSTYVTLYTYGYRNVYELAPLIDARHSLLPLEGSAAAMLR